MIKKIILFFLLFSPLYSEESTPVGGTLIVTFKTNQEGERLDRVRFWLKNSVQEISLYPKSQAYVEDLEEKNRMVVIENLPPDNYIIEFILPNQDNAFQIPPQKTLSVSAGETVKFNQHIQRKNEDES
jgi:hypothetical protein